jgi:hypothetical protein
MMEALVPIPQRSTSPRGNIDTVVAGSLKALDPKRPIKEAVIAAGCEGSHNLVDARFELGDRQRFLKKNGSGPGS